MKSVYENAALNLCAAGAAQSSQGSLLERDPDLVKSPIITVSLKGQERSDYQMTFYQLFWEDIRRSPLRNRGWVFQEWYLSKWSLILGRKQIWWQCQESLACETFPSGIPETFALFPEFSWVDMARQMKYNKQSDSIVSTSAQAKFDSHQSWGWIAHEYARTVLKRETDRLIAFSGVSQAFGDEFDMTDGYVAGMWRSHLPEALCWQNELTRTTRLDEYKSPSWSWTSINGPYELDAYIPNDVQKLCNVQDIWLDHVDKQHFTGLLRGGTITIRGRLVGPLVVEKVEINGVQGYKANIDDGTSNDNSDWIELVPDERDEHGDMLISYLDDLDLELCKSGSFDGAHRHTTSVWDAEGFIFYVPIFVSDQNGEYGLTLYQVEHQPGIYHRIAFARRNVMESFEDCIRNWENRVQEGSIVVV